MLSFDLFASCKMCDGFGRKASACVRLCPGGNGHCANIRSECQTELNTIPFEGDKTC